jgi:hypothetical protein
MAKEVTPAKKSQLEAKDQAHVRKASATRLGQLRAEASQSAEMQVARQRPRETALSVATFAHEALGVVSSR